MKLWRAYWHDTDAGRCQSWHLSARDAQRAVENSDASDDGPRGFDRMDIKNGRTGFAEFLNRYFTRDNG